jgi:hypothetical protein
MTWFFKTGELLRGNIGAYLDVARTTNAYNYVSVTTPIDYKHRSLKPMETG